MAKIAVCLGHSRKEGGKIEGGAVNYNRKVQEHPFNNSVAELLADKLEALGHEVRVYKLYEGNGYTAAMTWLGAQLAEWGADCAVELHFNSSDSPASNGHETLYWHSSTEGKRGAECFEAAFRQHMPNSRSRGDRGLVAITGEAQRGGGFLKRTPCPAWILEPFFGSNPQEWADYAKAPELAECYASALASYYGNV